MFPGQRIAGTKLEYNHVVGLKKGVGQKGDNQKILLYNRCMCLINICI